MEAIFFFDVDSPIRTQRKSLYVREGAEPGCKITPEAKSEACHLKEMRPNY